MQKLSKVIEKYLKSWEECAYCNDMCKLEILHSDNHDNPICPDCMEEEYGINGGTLTND